MSTKQKVNKKLFISVIIGLITFWYLLEPENKPENKIEDCYKLNTDIAVRLCITQYQPTRTPTPTPNLFYELDKIQITDAKLSYDGDLIKNLKFTGILTNNSQESVKNILILISFFNKGDDPNIFESADKSYIQIEEIIPPGKSIRVNEILPFLRNRENKTWTLQIKSAERVMWNP